jgi:hypothetical protein
MANDSGEDDELIILRETALKSRNYHVSGSLLQIHVIWCNVELSLIYSGLQELIWII